MKIDYYLEPFAGYGVSKPRFYLEELIMNKLSSLKFLFMPSFWIMSEKYCSKWDKEVNEALDNVTIVNGTKYDATRSINGLSIWTKNYPYGYGTSCFNGPRCSRETILRLKKFFDKWDRMFPSQRENFLLDQLGNETKSYINFLENL